MNSLAFIPENDVIDGLDVVAAMELKKFNPMRRYFENTFIGGFKKTNKTMRKKPLYAISIWSSYLRVLNDEARNNNRIEAWQKQFESAARKHSSINKFIEQFRV